MQKCKSENVKQSKHKTKQSEKQTIIVKKNMDFPQKHSTGSLSKYFKCKKCLYQPKETGRTLCP